MGLRAAAVGLRAVAVGLRAAAVGLRAAAAGLRLQVRSRFAIVFRDLSNNLLHSSVWDIPASVTALPKAVEEVAMPKEPAGSKQSKGYNGEYGYQGPCPPNEHSYVFTLYALDVATLPNVTTSSKLADIVKELEVHAILTATLQATFKP